MNYAIKVRKRITGILPRWKIWMISAAFLYFVFTVAITYPLIKDLSNQIPADLGDPLLNIWTIWWDSERIINLDFNNYFDANVMFPYKNTLAFSEHLTGEAILGLPFYLITKNPVFTYNILYILSFIAAGLGMFILTYHITGSYTASFFAGFIYSFVPHRTGQAGHIQTLWSGFFPLCIYYLLKLIDEIKIKNLLLLSFFIILQSLMNMYYIVYMGLILLITGIPYLIYKRKITDIKLYIHLISAAILSLIILLPFLLPYIELRESFGLTRDIRTISSLPELKNLIGISRFNALYKDYFAALDINEGSFFLGIMVSLLAITGVLSSKIKEIYRFILILMITFSFLIICGPNPVIPIKDKTFNYGFLYRLLYDLFPAFDGTRVPMRFYIFIVMAISVFAGSATGLAEKIKFKPVKILLYILLTVIISAEYYSKIPVIRNTLFTNPPEILQTLKSLENGAVIYFPLRNTYQHILYSAITKKPAYTSFTGYIHPLDAVMNEIETNPVKTDTLKILSAVNIRYIVLTDRVLTDRFDKIPDSGDIKIRKVYDKADGTIYSLNYRFKGYFTYNNFADISYYETSNKYYFYLKTTDLSDNIKIPLRQYFRVAINYKKEGKPVKSEDLKIKVPELIKESQIFLTENNKSEFYFNEVEVVICGNKNNYKRLSRRLK